MTKLTVQFSDVCNFNCPYCPTRKYNKEGLHTSHLLPYDIWNKAVCENFNPDEVIIDVTGGGEPMLHPQAFELLQNWAELGYKILLRTNGSKPYPKHENIYAVTAWHIKWGNRLPEYYDKILIIMNPNDNWEWKKAFCIENNILYYLIPFKDHSLPVPERKTDNGAKIKNNKYFKYSWVIYPDGNHRVCDRRIPSEILKHPNIKSNKPNPEPCCLKCEFVYLVEEYLPPNFIKHCEDYYENQRKKEASICNSCCGAYMCENKNKIENNICKYKPKKE